MKRFLIAVAALSLIAVPVFAGGDCSSSKEDAAQTAGNKYAEHEKCSADAVVCLNKMASKLQNRGWVGIEMEQTDGGELEILGVEPDSPAERAGLRKGDVLVAMNGIDYAEENKERMHEAYNAMTPGRTVTYTVDRKGKNREIDVELGRIPEAVVAKWIGNHMLQGHAEVEIAQN
ncbi:MAG: PDZ domain-containing protein [bacterium]|nr:PDZ domain-containing protein [bacterium]